STPTRTSCGPGSGTGTSRSSIRPTAERTAARMLVTIPEVALCEPFARAVVGDQCSQSLQTPQPRVDSGDCRTGGDGMQPGEGPRSPAHPFARLPVCPFTCYPAGSS